MKALDELIPELALALAERGASFARDLAIDEVSFDLPIETRLEGGLRVSLPQGLMATGFDAPLGRLRFLLERIAP